MTYDKVWFVTTIAEPDFLRKSHRWYEIGFFARTLPLTYGYARPTKIRIYRSISSDTTEIPPKQIWLPHHPVSIKPNKKLNLRLIELAMETRDGR